MDKKIAVTLRHLQQAIKHHIESERHNDGIELTHAQVHLLMYVHSKKCIYQKDIEQHLRIRPSSATEMINILERDDYIIRVKDDLDGRMKRIVLTDKTYEVIDAMTLGMKKLDQQLRQNISDEDLDVYFKVMDQMKKNLSEEEND